MSYFSRFPRTTFLNQQIVNLATAVKLNNLIKNESFSLLIYDIEEGDKPDDVAARYYGSPSYVWLVLLSNKILDPYYQWPLTVKEFEDWIKKKYGNLATAQATTIHCEHKTKNITVSADSLTVSNGVSASDYTAIDAYTYWDQINENRRHIKLIDRRLMRDVDKQFANLMK